MDTTTILTLGLLAGSLSAFPVSADEETPQWPQFLGAGGLPVASGSASAALRLDRERDVQWQVAVPGGSSSPCVYGDRLFLTAHDAALRHMIAFDRHSGRELWRHTVESPGLGPKAHVDADTAAPTPCTDGERVIFYFGGYGLVARGMDGTLLWEHTLPVPEAAFGIGTSPIIVDDLVVLSRDGCPDSSFMALDKRDGTERWRVPRLGYTFSFGTPFVWDNTERRELVFAGTTRIVSFDPTDGTELWQVAGQADFICTTPTADADTLYFAAWSTGGAGPAERAQASWGDLKFTPEELADGRKAFARVDADGDGVVTREELPESRARDAFVFVDRSGDGVLQPQELVPLITMPQGTGRNIMVAIAAGGKGDISDTHVRWRHRRGLPYVASPLLYDGRIYLVKSGGFVTCLDAATGQAHFDRQRLDDRSEYYASPVGVDGHVVVCSAGGSAFVLRAADDFELVRQVDFGEAITATPAIVDGTIYLRTDRTLWAFGG